MLNSKWTNKLFLVFAFLLCERLGIAQETATLPVMPAQLGFPGLIYTPSAYFNPWKTVDVGFTHFSTTASKTYEAGESPERAFIGNITFLPFAEISLKLTRPYPNETDRLPGNKRFYGIGDRSVAVRFRILEESTKRPALVVGIQDPALKSTNYFNTYYAVASKTFQLKQFNLTTNAGFGYSSTSAETQFLNGFFGGVNINWKAINVLVEYDTEQFNIGIGGQLKDKVFLQLALVNGNGFSGNASFRFSLK